MQSRRLTLYACTTAHAAQAVPALARLPRLRACALTVFAGWTLGNAASDDDDSEPLLLGGVDADDWEDWVQPPPVAPLADRLTALTLAGATR